MRRHHKRRPKLYPFSAPTPAQTFTSSSSSNNVAVTWTDLSAWYEWKPNPFRGIDRVVFAVDAWAHEHLPVRVHRLAFGWLCDWWDRRLIGRDSA